MPVDGADVLDAQILEHPLRGHDVLDPLLDTVKRLEHGAPHDRRPIQRAPAPAQELLVAAGGAKSRQMMGDATDGGPVGPTVVIDDDDDAAIGGGDVVERLPGHPTGQGPIADYSNNVAVSGLAALLPRLGEAVGVGQGGRSVRVLDPVVRTLGPTGVPRHAAALPQGREATAATGQDLMDVRLMSGIPQDGVIRRVEHAMQGDGELHHPQIGTQVAPSPRHRMHQEVTDLVGKDRQLLVVEPRQIRWAVDALDDRHPLSLRAPPPQGIHSRARHCLPARACSTCSTCRRVSATSAPSDSMAARSSPMSSAGTMSARARRAPA